MHDNFTDDELDYEGTGTLGTGTLSDPGPEDSDGDAEKQIAGALPPQNVTGCDMGMLDQSKIELFLDEGCGCSGHKGALSASPPTTSFTSGATAAR